MTTFMNGQVTEEIIDDTVWEYISPTSWREALRGFEIVGDTNGAAWARLVLEAVAAGQTIITGEEGTTVFFTGPKRIASPLAP